MNRYKNLYCTYLVHSTADVEKSKGLRNNFLRDLRERDRTAKYGTGKTPEEAEYNYNNRTPQQIKESVDARRAVDSSSKALANHEWYMANKDWKKEYNQEYYQRNKDYWEKRYKEASDKWDNFDLNDMKVEVSPGNSATNIENIRMDYSVAAENVQRARQEYNTFMKNNVGDLEMMVASLRQPQAKSFVSNGIIKITKILKPISGALASQLS